MCLSSPLVTIRSASGSFFLNKGTNNKHTCISHVADQPRKELSFKSSIPCLFPSLYGFFFFFCCQNTYLYGDKGYGTEINASSSSFLCIFCFLLTLEIIFRLEALQAKTTSFSPYFYGVQATGWLLGTISSINRKPSNKLRGSTGC